MSQQRKLPVAFWLLLLAAIAVALVLIVGIILENKSDPKPTPTPPPPAASAPGSTALEVSAKPSELKCAISDLTLSGADALSDARLVGWSDERFQLTFWALSQKTATLAKFSLAQIQPGSAKLEVVSKQDLVCKTHQEPGCLYLSSEKTNGIERSLEQIVDLSLKNEIGLASLAEAGKPETSKPVLARIENGRLMFHETLGLCGKELRALPDLVQFDVVGRDEARTLRLYDQSAGGVYHYETLGANAYSRNETALHPTYAQQASSQGLTDINCRALPGSQDNQGKRYSLREIQTFGSKTLAIASGKRTFDSDQELWVLETTGTHAKLLHQLSNAKLGFSPGSLMFESSEKAIVSSSNFFQTKTASKSLDLQTGAIETSEFAGAWPGEALIPREVQRSSSKESDGLKPELYFVFGDSKKISGAVRVGSSIISLAGKFAPEEKPRLLLTARAPNDWMLLYQGVRAEAPRAVRIVCSK